jgi:hypothetical protein
MVFFTKKDPNEEKAKVICWIYGELATLPPTLLKDSPEEQRLQIHLELQLVTLILLEDAIFAKLGPGAHPIWGQVIALLQKHKLEGAVYEPRYQEYRAAYYERLKELKEGRSDLLGNPLYFTAKMVATRVFGDRSAMEHIEVLHEMMRRFELINKIVATDQF